MTSPVTIRYVICRISILAPVSSLSASGVAASTPPSLPRRHLVRKSACLGGVLEKAPHSRQGNCHPSVPAERSLLPPLDLDPGLVLRPIVPSIRFVALRRGVCVRGTSPSNRQGTSVRVATALCIPLVQVAAASPAGQALAGAETPYPNKTTLITISYKNKYSN